MDRNVVPPAHVRPEPSPPNTAFGMPFSSVSVRPDASVGWSSVAVAMRLGGAAWTVVAAANSNTGSTRNEDFGIMAPPGSATDGSCWFSREASVGGGCYVLVKTARRHRHGE